MRIKNDAVKAIKSLVGIARSLSKYAISTVMTSQITARTMETKNPTTRHLVTGSSVSTALTVSTVFVLTIQGLKEFAKELSVRKAVQIVKWMLKAINKT